MDWGSFFGGLAAAAVALLGAWGVYEGRRQKMKMQSEDQSVKIRKEVVEIDRGILPEYKELFEKFEERDKNWAKAAERQSALIEEYQTRERECHARGEAMRVWVNWAVPRMAWMKDIATTKAGFEVGPDLPPPKIHQADDDNISFRARTVSQTVKLLKATSPAIQPTQAPSPPPLPPEPNQAGGTTPLTGEEQEP